jgi:hypothetical protein
VEKKTCGEKRSLRNVERSVAALVIEGDQGGQESYLKAVKRASYSSQDVPLERSRYGYSFIVVFAFPTIVQIPVVAKSLEGQPIQFTGSNYQ